MTHNTQPNSRRRSPAACPAFTIVELLVVLAVIGILIGLCLPAVQYSREMARRANCANNLRNQALALQHFHDAHMHLPPGRHVENTLEFSWCLQLLPFLEQQGLSQQFNRRKAWHDPAGNLAVSNAAIQIFRCPSSVVRFPGDSDYGGMMGSALTSDSVRGAFNNGVLIEVRFPGGVPLAMASIIDGASQTICIAESADRAEPNGRWVSGLNCLSHDNGAVSTQNAGEIFSLHHSGANVGFADGSVRFLTTGIAPYVIGALCTRDHREVVEGFAY